MSWTPYNFFSHKKKDQRHGYNGCTNFETKVNHNKEGLKMRKKTTALGIAPNKAFPLLAISLLNQHNLFPSLFDLLLYLSSLFSFQKKNKWTLAYSSSQLHQVLLSLLPSQRPTFFAFSNTSKLKALSLFYFFPPPPNHRTPFLILLWLFIATWWREISMAIVGLTWHLSW